MQASKMPAPPEFKTKPHVRPRLENLFGGGGGLKGLFYIGVLRALKKLDILAGLKRVGGTSVGSLMFLPICVGHDPEYLYKRTKKKIQDKTLDIFKDFIHPDEAAATYYQENELDGFFTRSAKKVYNQAAGFCLFAKSAATIPLRGGILHGSQMAKEAQAIIDDSPLAQRENVANLTFGELHHYKEKHPDLNLKDFYIPVVNVTDQNKPFLEILSWEKTPDVRIRDAIRATMSVPFMYAPAEIVINGKINKYWDGGVFLNEGVSIFDDNRYFDDGCKLIADGKLNLLSLLPDGKPKKDKPLSTGKNMRTLLVSSSGANRTAYMHEMHSSKKFRFSESALGPINEYCLHFNAYLFVLQDTLLHFFKLRYTKKIPNALHLHGKHNSLHKKQSVSLLNAISRSFYQIFTFSIHAQDEIQRVAREAQRTLYIETSKISQFDYAAFTEEVFEEAIAGAEKEAFAHYEQRYKGKIDPHLLQRHNIDPRLADFVEKVKRLKKIKEMYDMHSFIKSLRDPKVTSEQDFIHEKPKRVLTN